MKKTVDFLKNNKKIITIVVAVVLVAVITCGLTWALLKNKSNGITNTFVATTGGVEANEEFDGTVKKNVNAANTGDYHAYIRVQLITYRVNDNGDRIGGTATVPTFTPGTGWIKAEDSDTYYYTLPVAPKGKPAANLIGSDGITLQKYSDVDGGKQVVDVVAESIQSSPINAVTDSWGVTVDQDGVITGFKEAE